MYINKNVHWHTNSMKRVRFCALAFVLQYVELSSTKGQLESSLIQVNSPKELVIASASIFNPYIYISSFQNEQCTFVNDIGLRGHMLRADHVISDKIVEIKS